MAAQANALRQGACTQRSPAGYVVLRTLGSLWRCAAPPATDPPPWPSVACSRSQVAAFIGEAIRFVRDDMLGKMREQFTQMSSTSVANIVGGAACATVAAVCIGGLSRGRFGRFALARPKAE